ncbi:MAG: transglycosylase SLT domain-containing protein, partial [Pseudomonadota bacterium]|nr:transglycosylase SLT domain-containing protein [Pseudomonadota bacterium]
SQQNVEAGSAYLHILNSRYLRKIDDPMSRLYCAIAAYNTGVGNVAKAFNNGQSGGMSDAVVAKINAMSPDAVYDFLKVNLPYEETRRYLVKVKSRMEKYQNI